MKNIGLWVLQVLLGLAMLAAGASRFFVPEADLFALQPWAAAIPRPLLLGISVLEIAGGLGLILPMLTRIQPRLTPIAAIGLLLTMLGAALFHISRGEFMLLPPNVIYGALFAVIAYGRRGLLRG